MRHMVVLLSIRSERAGNVALAALTTCRGGGRSRIWHHPFGYQTASVGTAVIAEGFNFLDLSASGTDISEYHIEAAIASHHARAMHWQDTDWEAIVSLYDTLMLTRPSPIVALNRAIAIAESSGPARGLEEIRSIADLDRLSTYPFYFAALGELELRRGDFATALEHFRAALALARNPMECRFLDQRMRACARADAV